MDPIEIIDEYQWSDKKKVLTFTQMNVKNLAAFGRLVHKKANVPLPCHFHKNKKEFHIIVEGLQEYEVDNKTFITHGGEMFLNFENESHGTGTSLQSNNEIIWFQLDLSNKENFLGLYKPWSTLLYDAVISYNKRITPIRKELIQLIREAFECFSHENMRIKLRGYSKFVDFLTTVVLDENEHSSNKNYFIERALQYIDDHIFEELSLAKISKSLNISESHFKKEFKEKTGITPNKYINHKKIEHAKKILKNENVSILEIAMKLGFSSSQYFATVFQKFTNQTPLEFRNKNPKN